MQSSRYFPFERNRYFYGKLLTVRDFESEQKYFNDKRRLLNRLLYGPGVVSGLQVIKVDDKTVSVEMGVALDDLGREIVVASPVTLKLSMADGFTNNEYAKNVYLCITYDEKGKEPVHSIANSARVDEVSEYNRLYEGFKLKIKEKAPSPAQFAFDTLTHSTSVLFEDTDSQVRVLQIAPRYVPVNETFEVKIRFEKTFDTPRMAFEFQVDETASAPLLLPQGTTFHFADPGDQESTHYEFSYVLQASGTPEAQGKILFKPNTAKLSIGDRQVDINPTSENVVEAVAGAVSDRILEDYYNRSLDQSMETIDDSCIYLAKINLRQVGPTYMIEQVEPVPFGEYVYNSTMMMKLGMLSEKAGQGTFGVTSTAEMLPEGSQPSLEVDYDRVKQEMHFKLGVPQSPKPQEALKLTTGVAEIVIQSQHKGLNPFGKPTRNFYSDEIEHGLGLGDVLITTGVDNVSTGGMSDLLKQGERTYYGDSDVFEESEFDPDVPNVSIGVVVFPKKGTFRIGVKLHHATDLGKLRVRWWAYKSLAGQQQQEQAVPVAQQEQQSANEAAVPTQADGAVGEKEE